MSHFRTRDASSSSLSTTAIVAIVTGVGVVFLCSLVVLAIALIRAHRKHKRLLADLEERGVSMSQAQDEASQSAPKPRAVLRRNTVLPHSTKLGWSALPSTETFTSAGATVVAHYAPPKPTEDAKRYDRLSWPFSTKRMSGNHVQMKKMKGSRLSTVLEDPKISISVPILRCSHMHGGRPSMTLSRECGTAGSSSQSLLQHHPAFRNPSEGADLDEQTSRANGGSFFRAAANSRLQRARSIAAIPSAETVRVQPRARSTSLCSSASGMPPDVILPPLPLDIARIKSEAKRRSQLRRIPSKLSVSSFGSADTSILAHRASPIVPQATKVRPPKITKSSCRSPGGVRQFRDTLDLRTKVLDTQHLDNTAHTQLATLEGKDIVVDSSNALSADPKSHSVDTTDSAELVTSNMVSSPIVSPLTTRSRKTAKRRSKTFVSSAGSPERQSHNEATLHSLAGTVRSPKRQHSQTSSRSSGGNPFQWDSMPLSTGKPSALKGSPSARQGHRRKNSVRISLVPTIHGPPSRATSPSLHDDKKKDTTEGASANDSHGHGLGLVVTRSLPTPPSSSMFAPELKFSATSLRASLTPTSPTLPLVNYDQQSYVVLPTDYVLPELSAQEQERLSSGSVFSLSRFPAIPSIIEPTEYDLSYQPEYRDFQPNDFNDNFHLPDTPALAQYPFRPQTPEHPRSDNRSPSPTSLIDMDEYDPERSDMVFQTPANTTSRAWQSAFPTIPEESSVTSSKTVDNGNSRYDDSPPVSPKTVSPPRFTYENRSAYLLPVYATAIPEKPMGTIDPAILSKDAFLMLNNGVNHINGSIMDTSTNRRSSLARVLPTIPESAQSVFEPLLEAGFPLSPPLATYNELRVVEHVSTQSQRSSMYSSPLPSASRPASPTALSILPLSQVSPCSPRPSHAQLPTPGLSINFAELPKLAPPRRGPRGSPPRPLRSSIVALRRMNSDAADAKKEKVGRGERRYLWLGREESVQLPGDESWLDEIEDEQTVELDEEEGRRLVGDVLDDYDEGCTVLNLDDDNTEVSLPSIKPQMDGDTTSSTGVYEKVETPTSVKRSSSIWEDGEKFWASNTPPRPAESPTRPKHRYQPLASSPLATPSINTNVSSISTSRPSGKRDFAVAKDAPTALSPTENPTRDNDTKKRRESSSNRYTKKSALSAATPNVPNVRIQVTTPSGHVVGAGVPGTPGSMYDSQGFLTFE